MKIIVMKVNTKKNNKKSKRKNNLKNFFSEEHLNTLTHMKNEEIDYLFERINKNIDETPNNIIKKMYLNSLLGMKKYKKSSLFTNKLIKEIALDIDDSQAVEKSLERTNIHWYNKLTIVSKKIIKKLIKVLNSPITKSIVITGISIALYYLYSNESLACGGFEEVGTKIDKAYYIIRMTTAVVCFVYLCIELSQNVVKGDMRALWFIIVKYIIFITAIVSYRKIFAIIDALFN